MNDQRETNKSLDAGRGDERSNDFDRQPYAEQDEEPSPSPTEEDADVGLEMITNELAFARSRLIYPTNDLESLHECLLVHSYTALVANIGTSGTLLSPDDRPPAIATQAVRQPSV